MGRSGGLFCLWNPSIFKVDLVIKGGAFILISGTWNGVNDILNVVNVYAPINSDERKKLWSDILHLRHSRRGIWLVIGDFNEVCSKEDRFSKAVCVASMEEFNRFIRQAAIEELSLGGRRFTWMSSDGRSLSKIDRIFVNDRFLHHWPSAAATVLPRRFSDHCPLLLSCEYFDYGPIPFRFFNSWLLLDGFMDIVNLVWNSDLDCQVVDLRFLKKLQLLKKEIRLWRSKSRDSENKEYDDFLKNIDELELLAEKRSLSSPERDKINLWRKQVMEIDNTRNLDLKQKARIKWEMEGDENSKFFHGMINSHRKRNKINGIMFDGAWLSNPKCIKDAIFDYFSAKFDEVSMVRPKMSSNYFHKLGESDRELLEGPFLLDEVKKCNLVLWQ